jgi:mannose-6-phosphate isomerase
MSELYPLKFNPIIKETLWGGDKLNKVLKKKTPSSGCGESWEISSVKNNISVVSDGFLSENNLEELIEIYMGDLVGDKVYEKFGIAFPLLLKFIDANDVLSIQVHPDDKLAEERHQSFGKTEMWYILENTPGAELIVGFNQKMTRQLYLEHFKNNTLKEILNNEKVKPGDVFFIPAGRIHAIGAGILLAEIQQTSDITYRIYDWDRKDASGKSRELHTEQAVDAIDYTFHKTYRSNYIETLNKTNNIIDCPYFFTNILTFNQPVEKDYNLIDSFVIYMCVEGEFNIQYNKDETVAVKKGETILLPAVLKNVTLNTNARTKILEVYIK